VIDEVWKLVHDIETGAVSLSCDCEPQNVYAGNVLYTASNGWKLVVFNDCNEWDYFDRFIAPDGRQLDYAEMPEEMRRYSPGDEVSWRAYGIPCYRKDRNEKWPGAKEA
jgi:hypothetical protein